MIVRQEELKEYYHSKEKDIVTGKSRYHYHRKKKIYLTGGKVISYPQHLKDERLEQSESLEV